MTEDSHMHIVRTSEQWNKRSYQYYTIPRGCLCIELTSKGKTKLKVGEGNKYYHQLPYVCEVDLSVYYTKEEVDNIINNLNYMSIASTDVYESKNSLPKVGNKLGDVRFVENPNPSLSTDPIEYIWNGSKWLPLGVDYIIDIDLSEYVKRAEIIPRIERIESQLKTYKSGIGISIDDDPEDDSIKIINNTGVLNVKQSDTSPGVLVVTSSGGEENVDLFERLPKITIFCNNDPD